MALLYFRDAEKANESGKVWMGKAAVRKIIDQRDEKYKALEIKAIGLEAQMIMGEACIAANEAYIKDLEKLNKKFKIGLGVSIGVNVLSAIIWCSSHFAIFP